jgi:hypothetical protein
MQTIRNIFACLVHERQDCVVDLVRNLRALDPGSLILLYNGGRDPNLPDFGIHMDQSREFGIWSSGPVSLFSVEGGTGNAWVKGNLAVEGGALRSSKKTGRDQH